MRILTRLRDELDHARRVWRGHDRLTEAQDDYFSSDSPASMAVAAEQIADRLDSQADHLDASWLARVTTSLPPTDEMRLDATEWRKQAAECWTAAANTTT